MCLVHKEKGDILKSSYYFTLSLYVCTTLQATYCAFEYAA